jgi:hypothetical protein
MKLSLMGHGVVTKKESVTFVATQPPIPTVRTFNIMTDFTVITGLF